MTIGSDKARKILHDVIHNVDPKDSRVSYGAAEHAHRAGVEAQVEDIKAKGQIPDLPHEWHDPSAEDIAAARERYGDGS